MSMKPAKPRARRKIFRNSWEMRQSLSHNFEETFDLGLIFRKHNATEKRYEKEKGSVLLPSLVKSL